MKRLALLALAAVAVGIWWGGRGQPLEAGDVWLGIVGDAARGEGLFHLSGCGSCHSSPDAEAESAPRLGGGDALETPFGVFRAPNISPDVNAGIGSWNLVDFANAMWRGLAPDGRHYYPSFPYTSYALMSLQDLADLKAYLDGLPPVATRSAAHELAFPWSQRWALGWWKRLYLDASPVAELPESTATVERGRYLVEGPGHCGECHTPRNVFGALRRDRWLAGAPSPDGQGSVPNLTPHADGLAGWSGADLVYYFESGIDPEFDVVGGEMVAVQENLARLDREDLEAIAAYLAALAPLE